MTNNDNVMKKIIFSALAVCALICGCQKNDLSKTSEENDKLYVTIEDVASTKTLLDEDNNVRWSEGDQIAAFLKTSSRSKYQVSSSGVGNASASFECISGTSGSATGKYVHNIAYYPYSDAVDIDKLGDNYLLDVSLPVEQRYVPDSFGPGSFPMVAVSEDNHLSFNNVCGGIKLLMTGTKRVVSIKLEGKNKEKLSGPAIVVAYSDGTKPAITMTLGASTSVTLNCGHDGVQLNENEATEFIMALPPVVFSKGFTVSVCTMDGMVYTADTDKANTVLRSSLLVMTGFNLDEKPEVAGTDWINNTIIEDGNDLVGLVSDSVTGEGIPDVAVSDGYSVVRTDANGVYQFKSNQKARNVFISVPAEFEVPLSDKNTPLFYKSVLIDGTVKRNDFILAPLSSSEENFTFVAIGDPQVKKSSHVTRFSNETINDIKQTLTKHQNVGKYLNAYAVTLGDLVHDKPELWESIVKTMHDVQLGSGEYLPVFQCIGNHDHDASQTSDYDAVGNFIRNCGPTDYSFNRGKVHFVVMDNVVCTDSKGTTWNYKSGFSDEQYEWLRQDIDAVDNKDDKMMIICCHIPFKSEVSFKNHLQEILAMMGEFNEAHFMIGHTHYQQNYIHKDYKTRNGLPIYEHIHGGACGGWWACNLNVDGSPNGYSIYEIEGNHMKNWVAKGTGLQDDCQMRVYDGNQTYTGTKGYIYNWYQDSVGGSAGITYKGRDFLKDCFVVNLWNADDTYWTVEFTYNGKTVPMKRADSSVMDAAAVSFFFNECSKNTTSWTKALDHFWYIESPDGLDPSEVTGWTITATQTIPGSGEVNVYTSNSLQVDYTGF